MSIKTKSGETINNFSIIACQTTGIDLCLIKTEFKPKTFIDISKNNVSKIGSRVAVIGHPNGLEWTISDGLVSAFRDSKTTNDNKYQEVQISAPISPGSSGGPILDDKGQLVGVITSGFFKPTASDLNFGVSFGSVKDFYNRSIVLKPLELKSFMKVVQSDNKAIAKLVFDKLISPKLKELEKNPNFNSDENFESLNFTQANGKKYSFLFPKFKGQTKCTQTQNKTICAVSKSDFIIIEEVRPNPNLSALKGKKSPPVPLNVIKNMIAHKMIDVSKLTPNQKKFLYSNSDPVKCAEYSSPNLGKYNQCSEFTYNFENPNNSLFIKWIQTSKFEPIIQICTISNDAFTSLVPFGVSDLIEFSIKENKGSATDLVESRLKHIYVSMQAFKAEFDSYTSDFVGIGTLPPLSPHFICGFYKPFATSSKLVLQYSKPSQINESFLGKTGYYNQQTLSLLKFIPSDAVVEQNKFKVACVSNTDSDPEVAIWTIDEMKNIVQVSED